jgi:Zn-dependent alcohol dehydrogenase
MQVFLCRFAGWKSRDNVPKLVEAYMGGSLEVDKFVTTEIPLDTINQAFDDMHKGTT